MRRRFTTFESALACLVSLLLYIGYRSVASAAKWRHDQEADALAEPLLSEVALLIPLSSSPLLPDISNVFTDLCSPCPVLKTCNMQGASCVTVSFLGHCISSKATESCGVTPVSCAGRPGEGGGAGQEEHLARAERAGLAGHPQHAQHHCAGHRPAVHQRLSVADDLRSRSAAWLTLGSKCR